MNLINNLSLYTGDSKEIALAAQAHDPSLKLDPTVAYIVTMTSLRPLLEKSFTPTIAMQPSLESLRANNAPAPSPTFVAASKKIDKILEGHFENIKDHLGSIQKVISQLEEKAAFFLGLRAKGEGTFIVGEEWKEFEDKFINSTKKIMDAVSFIRESVKKLRSILSKNATYPALDKIEKYCQNLVDKMPDPSGKWNAGKVEYDGLKWLHKSINGQKLAVFANWETWFAGIKSPVGLLEMVLDKNTSTKDVYLDNIQNGLESVEELFANVARYSRMLEREEIMKHFKSLPTEEAYVYLIATVLPMLQNEASANLEEQGNTMKLLSGIFDKWNSIQDLITKSIKQSDQSAAAADALGNKIKNVVKDIQHQLKRAEMYLPSSAHSLLDTMKQLSDRLITEYPKDFLKVANDSDQTAFKSYMDNLGQGVTAFTSISNMTQQQLQIDTQYYNSLLSIQKSSQDSLNKVVQSALNNMRF